MIRPFTCLCLVAACGSGLYLYSEKHRTAMLDRDISNVIHATEAARARTGMLRAEWALQNEPGRLQELADKYLALKPMAPTQFVQLADLPAHLPPPETAAEMAAGTTDDDDGTIADGSAAPADPAAPASDATPAQMAADIAVTTLPARVLAPKPDPQAGARLLARADTKAKPAHHVVVADHAYTPPQNGMLARGAPLPLAAQPVGARVFSAMARPLPQQSYPSTPVSATPRFATPYVGSALGGRGALPPPVPYGGEQ
jgi:hypothetical protein